MTLAKRDKIAPVSIFFLFYISRMVVSLTSIQSVTTGLMKTDILVSIILSMVCVLVLSAPVIYCIKKHKSPFDIKWIGFLYSLYFIFIASVNISRFSYFASTILNPDSRAWLFCVVVAVCAFYGAYLGIEGLSRFSAFVFALLVLSIGTALAFNIKNFEPVNLHPAITNDTQTILKNVAFITSGTPEIAAYLCLSKKVNGCANRSFARSVCMSFLSIFLLFFVLIGVMGDGASLQSFPLYTLFQLAKTGIFQRIDVLYISFWIMGIFVKAVLFVYCASISFKPMKNRTKCAVSAVLAAVASIIFTQFVQIGEAPIWIYAVPFLVFCVIIPVLCLFFKKRNLGDELVEKF